MSVWVTGDTHHDWIRRLNVDSFPWQRELTKTDVVIILGDFGIWEKTKEEKYLLDWLETRSFTTLFVDGNHENFDILDALPVGEWHGGRVHFVRPSVIHLMRGEVFEVEGKRFFAFGGGASHDIRDGILEPGDPRIREWQRDDTKLFRVNHVSWWERELPSAKELRNGWQNLERYGNSVDYVLTHSPYAELLVYFGGGRGRCEKDYLISYLQDIHDRIDFRHWFFGHMHQNRVFDWEKTTCLYTQILRML